MKAIYDKKTTAMMKEVQSMIDDRFRHIAKKLNPDPEQSTAMQMIKIKNIEGTINAAMNDPILAMLRKRQVDLISLSVPIWQVMIDNKA